MKKFYLEPNTKIVKIKPRLMLTTSGEFTGLGTNDTDLHYQGGGTGEGRSRGVWDRWDD